MRKRLILSLVLAAGLCEAAPVDDLVSVARAIDARYQRKLTTVLSGDAKKLHAALAAIDAAPPVVVPPVVVVPPPEPAAKKWRPGHYVRCNCLGYAANQAERAYAINTVRNEPLIVGVLTTPLWGTIEPQAGQYDFSVIDQDLAAAKAIGKKLIIEVWWQKYGSTNTRDARHFPQYIIDADGVQINGDGSLSVQMQEAKWQDRYIALQKALAAKYDSDAAVEQIAITETASTSAYGFLRVVPAVAALWPHTQVVLYPNWVDTPELARDLLAVMAPLGVGVGAPDIIGPSGFNYEDHGSQALRGVGVRPIWGGNSTPGDFGHVDYRGKIPIAYQWQQLNGVPASKVIDYARNTLKVTHAIWTIGDQWASDTLPTIKANPATVATRPALLP